jgi:hypothetical protein
MRLGRSFVRLDCLISYNEMCFRLFCVIKGWKSLLLVRLCFFGLCNSIIRSLRKEERFSSYLNDYPILSGMLYLCLIFINFNPLDKKKVFPFSYFIFFNFLTINPHPIFPKSHYLDKHYFFYFPLLANNSWKCSV